MLIVTATQIDRIGLQDSTVQVLGIESPSGVSDKDLYAADSITENYPIFNHLLESQYQVSSNRT